MAAEKYLFKTVNGDTLKGFSWKADKAKANLVIVTGMEEHSFRYNDFALFMNKNGFNVVCVYFVHNQTFPLVCVRII